jgi:hypothetical protein
MKTYMCLCVYLESNSLNKGYIETKVFRKKAVEKN